MSQASAEELERGFARCGELTKRFGTTYYWGALLLPPEQRRDVYSVYALCRLADDIVDEPETVADIMPVGDVGARLLAEPDPATRLTIFRQWFDNALVSGSSEPVMAAVADTVQRRGIDTECFDRFFDAMALDLHKTTWASWDELRYGYMEGSAAVIGEMMLPVLKPLTPEAYGPARALGLAFQLTNFIRDVGEDLDRGRIYLPQDELAMYQADPWRRRVDDPWREFMKAQLERNRELYAQAWAGVDMLPVNAARCVKTALVLYSEILDKIEAADYDVFHGRHRLPGWRKATTMAAVMVGSPYKNAPQSNDPRNSERTSDVSERHDVLATTDPVTPATTRKRNWLQPPEIPIERLPQPAEAGMRSTWKQANIRRINRSLDDALAGNPGGWYVIGASTDLGKDTSIMRTVGGVETVLWRRSDGSLVAGPGACPHMGASLADGVVEDSVLMCRWHGLEVHPDGDRRWSPFKAHDDGALLWVQIASIGEELLDHPVVPERPPLHEAVTTVVNVEAICEPKDIIANRLDPWHGAWFHPYAFSHLTVDDDASTVDRLVIDVAFRLNRTWGVPVRAEFVCPDARTIMMRIIEGEGKGSVVETHATPLGYGSDGRPRTMMTEATIAHSERVGFKLAKAFTPLLRPMVARTALQLWVDDLDYAERRYTIRNRAEVNR